MMRSSEPLALEDVRAIVRLLGEVVEIDSLVAQKRAVAEGICAIIGAGSWAWATTFHFKPGEVPLNSDFLSGGFTPGQFAKFQEALEHPDTAVLNQGFTREFEEKKAHITRLREQIDVSGYFHRSEVHPIWNQAGVEQVILSVRPRMDGALSQLGFYREPGHPPFSPRESRIVHIVLSEFPWLHEALLDAQLGETVVTLTPRQRITLNLLLDGQTRMEIAGHLGLAVATVDGYVKDVFRHFGVHSQPALIARFRSGDGGDVPGKVLTSG